MHQWSLGRGEAQTEGPAAQKMQMGDYPQGQHRVDFTPRLYLGNCVSPDYHSPATPRSQGLWLS